MSETTPPTHGTEPIDDSWLATPLGGSVADGQSNEGTLGQPLSPRLQEEDPDQIRTTVELSRPSGTESRPLFKRVAHALGRVFIERSGNHQPVDSAEAQAPQSTYDNTFSRDLAQGIESQVTSSKPYDPLAKWDQMHRTRKLNSEAILPSEKPSSNTSPHAADPFEEGEALRLGKERDKMLDRRAELLQWQRLYGDAIYSSDGVEAYIRSNRLSQPEAARMRQASKTVRRLVKKIQRTERNIYQRAHSDEG